MSPQELQVQQKREVEKNRESTMPARSFLPPTDIFENADALTIVMEMPGVDRKDLDINVEDGVLSARDRERQPRGPNDERWHRAPSPPHVGRLAKNGSTFDHGSFLRRTIVPSYLAA